MKLLALTIPAVLIVFCSCTKTVNNPAPVPTVDTLYIKDTIVIKDTIALQDPNTIVGLWVGEFTALNESSQGLYETFDLKADSTIQVQGEGADGATYYSAGTYSVSGTTFKATYTTNNFSNQGAVQSVTATWNASTGQISGTWVNAGNANSGSFSMTKVP